MRPRLTFLLMLLEAVLGLSGAGVGVSVPGTLAWLPGCLFVIGIALWLSLSPIGASLRRRATGYRLILAIVLGCASYAIGFFFFAAVGGLLSNTSSSQSIGAPWAWAALWTGGAAISLTLTGSLWLLGANSLPKLFLRFLAAATVSIICLAVAKLVSSEGLFVLFGVGQALISMPVALAILDIDALRVAG